MTKDSKEQGPELGALTAKPKERDENGWRGGTQNATASFRRHPGGSTLKPTLKPTSHDWKQCSLGGNFGGSSPGGGCISLGLKQASLPRAIIDYLQNRS